MKRTYYAIFDNEAMIIGDCYETLDECIQVATEGWTYDEFKDANFTVCEFDDEDGVISLVTAEYDADDIF